MSFNARGKVAIVTGASSGIGAATALALASAGFELALGARRMESLESVAKQIKQETGITPWISQLDVTSLSSAEQFVAGVVEKYGKLNVLVNNAGLARGTARVADVTDETDWREMLETNVMGLLRLTRLSLPHILASGAGHVINIGSTAGHDAYVGGSVYCGSKFAVRAITSALRQELLGQPVRVTGVDPGMVETEFSVVRYHGDEGAAKNVYAGMTPLTAEDVADCVVFAATRPAHVNIDTMIIKPTDQYSASQVARRS